MKKTTDIVKGKIENLKRVATRTANSMITFTVGRTACKAFGKGAETVSRWMQFDPNSAGEFEGYFDKRSERFGKEFVAVHGKSIEIRRAGSAAIPGVGMSGAGAPRPSAASVTTPSSPIEPILAKEPIGLKTGLAHKELPNPLSRILPTQASLPADDFAPAEGVTFEDLENQYKSQKLARKMEKLNQ
jgi:hypothetical protein